MTNRMNPGQSETIRAIRAELVKRDTEVARLRAVLERINIPNHCSLAGLSDAHTLGYWMGLAKGFANLAAQAVSADPSAVETCSSGWQPIETAPADGTEFIAFHKEAGVCACFRTGPTSAWYCMDGWNTYPGANGTMRPGLTSFIDPPECWMPMPKPPGSAVETSTEPKVGDEVTLNFTSAMVTSREGWKIDRIDRAEYFFLSDEHGSQISLLRGQFSVNGT